MQAKITMHDKEHGICTVTREKGDPRFRGVKNAAGESRLLYHLKGVLNAQGYAFVKVHMSKDGHLVGDTQQYLRERCKGANRRVLAIWNSRWAIAGAEEAFNRTGAVTLSVSNLGA